MHCFIERLHLTGIWIVQDTNVLNRAGPYHGSAFFVQKNFCGDQKIDNVKPIETYGARKNK